MSDETEALETPQVEQAEEKPVTEARVASSEPTTPDTVHVSVLAEKKKSVPRARRMKLSLTQIDPWSVTKVSFMLLIAVALIQVIAVVFLYYVLQAVGVFDSLTSIVSSAGLNSKGFDIASFISLGRVLSIFTIVSVFEIVVGTVLAAIGAFLYNIVSSLVGGIHVTLGDD
ncbi:DUF3566 domain-containing protein [Alloscardovia omnicolens]|uniref:DUF3566 domain-containing protein n=1 Tax=Alloscardovia omnicolens TaxID=419015 RepID=UPI0003B44B81|nr:DUF3566 domain-containing protein [Alloscardovia omnicolens]EGT4752354.1 DUF3566 domain-containing protein [Clostridioides difficile]KWZ75966.1 hypothetical protein HMPREF3214_00161 [Alloscardovia omnicolens]MBS6345849.1 DUF3566 domain-containing protein [Alloscardovia omnicolens]MDK6250120.1 DUF3566 domain-containing protein [Alloscardovia omnicolens]MDK6251275.1 DUF3566 domain-containing protein [Alloscardovia omnicolens]